MLKNKLSIRMRHEWQYRRHYQRRRFFETKITRPTVWWHYGCALIVAIGASLGSWANMSVAQAAQTQNQPECADVEFVFVRGSGEVLDDNSEHGKSFVAWRDNILTALNDINITTKFYNLGMSSHHGYQYPAVAVSGSLQGIVNLTGAYFSAGAAYEFGRSVEQGRGELIYYLIEEMQQCPKMKFVLGGYSQGAMILTQTLNQLYAPRILYVATFGDPKLYLPEGAGVFRVPDACRGVNLSPYREYVPDCHAYTGVLGSVRPYQPEAYAGKIGTWCNKSDIMCSSGMNIADHTAYVADNLYRDAAQMIRRKIRAAFPDRVAKIQNGNTLHNLALLFDATGSMREHILEYKREALRLASNVLQYGGKVRLYTYKDINHGSKPQAACVGDCSLAELDEIMTNLQTSGGGDVPESLIAAAILALNDFPWDYGATKTIVALTDANFHRNEYGVTVPKLVQRSLEIDPVNFYVITEREYTQDYQTLTAQTGGAIYDIASVESVQLSTEQIWRRPVAKLSASEYHGEVGEEFYFDAGASYNVDDSVLQFDWDLDGDGEFELTDVGAVVRKSYTAEFSDYIQVRVSDQYGSSTMSAKVEVAAQAYELVLPGITNLQVQERAEDKTVNITFTTNADKVLLGVNGVILGAVELGRENGKTTSERSMGKVTLDEVPKNTEVSLAPYYEGRRGETQTLQIFKTDDANDTDWPDLSEVVPDGGLDSIGDDLSTDAPDLKDDSSLVGGPGDGDTATNPVTSGKTAIGLASDQIKRPDSTLTENKMTFIVPKVPETGVRSLD